MALWLTTACGSFWALTMRKWGTVGTRTYAFPFLGCFAIMSVLCTGTPQESVLFNGAAIWLLVMLFFQITSTRKKRWKGEHVYSWHIGEPRYQKMGMNQGYLLEVVLGVLVGLGFMALEAQVFGGFIFCSAICCAIDVGMLETRDHLRTIQLRDAEHYQRYMVGLHGQRNSNRI